MAYLLPTPRATDGVNGGPNQRGSSGDLAMGSACQPQHWGKFAAAVALWEEITGMPAPEPTEPNSRGGRRLNPELSEWMMGYPRGYLAGMLARNDALRCAGNGVVTRQARAAWEILA
jgi:DNA (cytosine-5)-methyltransferase 1